MKNRIFKTTISILTIGLFLFLAFGSSADWKKKQFDTEEEFSNAFKNASYKDVKEEFGEPYYKFYDVANERISYRWKGVGVKGSPDAVLYFSAFEYGAAHISGSTFMSWYNPSESDSRQFYQKGNDGNPFYID